MKAVCKVHAGHGVKLVDAPTPKLTSHQVLIRVRAASICGTDIHIYQWDHWAAGRIKPPMIFGHEFSGEVIEIGAQVEHVAVGDHVSAETHIPCGGCLQCRTGQMHLCQNLEIVGVDRDGAFAEYVALPEICCVKNDPSLPWEIASVQEPLGNAVYCVSEAHVSGKSVAIFGDGPIGIFATAVARAYGAAPLFVSGMQPYRMEMARSYNPDLVIDARREDVRQKILRATGGQGVDVVMEMSGSPEAIHDAFAVVRRGGTFMAFGLPQKSIEIDLSEEVIFKGISIKAINGRRMFGTWHEMANLLRAGRIDVRRTITHEFPLSEIDRAMELLSASEVRAGKVILRP